MSEGNRRKFITYCQLFISQRDTFHKIISYLGYKMQHKNQIDPVKVPRNDFMAETLKFLKIIKTHITLRIMLSTMTV